MASKCFLKPFDSIVVAPVFTGISYIAGSTFVVSLYINSYILTSFPLPFSISACSIATSISMHAFSFLFLIIISGPFALTSLSVFTA
jgi:hypothetical protein